MSRRPDACFSLREIAELLDGELVFPTARFESRGVHDLEISDVTIDSRNAAPGSFFVPLPGRFVDGHEFISDAAGRGAGASFVSQEFFASHRVDLLRLTSDHDFALFVVRDVLSALQDLSRYYLGKVPDLVSVGVTGSNGKTTTKEMIGAILRNCGETFVTAGNLNSEIGLPLSILQLRPRHRFGVFEMAMNHRGEMQLLADILRPGAALITNIGTAHIGHIGSRDGIAEEKKKIFSRFSGHQDAFIPEDDDYTAFLSKGIHGTVHLYGRNTTEGFESAASNGLDGTTIAWNGRSIRLRVPGPLNVRNALGAISVCTALRATPDAIRDGLEAVTPLFGRGEVIRGAVTVIQDCYNANLDSMRGSIELLDSLAWNGRKIAILGEMKELGAFSEPHHRELGRTLAGAKVDSILLFGDEMTATLAALQDAGRRDGVELVDDMETLRARAAATVRTGDLVLLKGSRSTGLEALTPTLTGERQNG